VGASTSLVVDGSGNWHVSYADASRRTLRYMVVENRTAAGTPEVVDEGVGLGTETFDDAWHAVGDDSNLSVTDSGEVRIAYQDATAGSLRWAVGAPAAQGHTWTVKVLDQSGFSGFFPRQVTIAGETKVVTWWRVGGAEISGGVRLVTPQ